MMLRYSLRTLLILLAVGPPLVAGVWFEYQSFRQRQQNLVMQAGFTFTPMLPRTARK